MRHLLNLVGLALALAPGVATAQFASYKSVPIADRTLIERGASYNFATLEMGPSCIQWTGTIDNSTEFGAAEFNNNFKIDSSSDVASSLSVSYRSLFKAISSSESTEGSLSNEVRYKADKLTWLFRMRKARQALIIDDKTVKLRDDLPSDPVAFRARCGDYYVAGYATASTFYGIFELDKVAVDTDTNFALKLEESVNTLLASGSESTEVKAALKTAFSRSQARVIERASGSGASEALRATDLEGLIADYKAFKGQNPEPVAVILAPYPQHGATIQSAQETVMEDNAKLWFDYRDVADLANQAIATPETFYPLLPDGRTRWKKADVQAIRSAILKAQGWVADGIAACGHAPGTCDTLRDKLAPGASPDEAQDRLPKYLAWPDDCTDIRGAVADAPDGEYPLFYLHMRGNRYTAYCRNMAGSPTTYLKLIYTQAPDTNRHIHGSNFSQSAPDKDAGGNWKGTLVTTLWRGVAIDPKSLRVYPNDFGMADSTGEVVTHKDEHLTHANYAETRSCDGHDGNDGLALANVDLRGTSFRVDPSRSNLVTYYYSNGDGHGTTGASGNLVVANGGQVVDFISHWGYCALTHADPLYLTMGDGGR